jgi:C4-dicarboxylate-specific signal transduction histidine kinase
MGELTASLAHELNQPLTAIASNAAAGKRLLASGSSDVEMFQELLADVSADARRAGNIIHGIHHFVRKSTGTRRPINLNEIVQEVLRLLHSDLLGRGTTVETELAPSLPAVEADPVQLQQVLLNLLMNSIEAMQQTPAPLRRIRISSVAADGFVQVRCATTGSACRRKNRRKSSRISFLPNRPEWGWA